MVLTHTPLIYIIIAPCSVYVLPAEMRSWWHFSASDMLKIDWKVQFPKVGSAVASSTAQMWCHSKRRNTLRYERPTGYDLWPCILQFLRAALCRKYKRRLHLTVRANERISSTATFLSLLHLKRKMKCITKAKIVLNIGNDSSADTIKFRQFFKQNQIEICMKPRYKNYFLKQTLKKLVAFFLFSNKNGNASIPMAAYQCNIFCNLIHARW